MARNTNPQRIARTREEHLDRLIGQYRDLLLYPTPAKAKAFGERLRKWNVGPHELAFISREARRTHEVEVPLIGRRGQKRSK